MKLCNIRYYYIGVVKISLVIKDIVFFFICVGWVYVWIKCLFNYVSVLVIVWCLKYENLSVLRVELYWILCVIGN